MVTEFPIDPIYLLCINRQTRKRILSRTSNGYKFINTITANTATGGIKSTARGIEAKFVEKASMPIGKNRIIIKIDGIASGIWARVVSIPIALGINVDMEKARSEFLGDVYGKLADIMSIDKEDAKAKVLKFAASFTDAYAFSRVFPWAGWAVFDKLRNHMNDISISRVATIMLKSVTISTILDMQILSNNHGARIIDADNDSIIFDANIDFPIERINELGLSRMYRHTRVGCIRKIEDVICTAAGSAILME